MTEQGTPAAGQEPGQGTEPTGGNGNVTPPTGEPPKPPWGSDEEFDPKRAWKLIQDVRTDLDKTKTERDSLRQAEEQRANAAKSKEQLLEEGKTTAEQRATKAEADAARLRIALRKGLTETQAKRLVGDTEEDLEKDADELLASFRDEGEGQVPPRRPRERLRPGAAPAAEPEKSDPASLAAEVSRGW